MPAFLGILAVLLAASTALAWNRPGHMVIGAIAHDLLKTEHPVELAKAPDLLRHHLQYDDVISKWLAAVPAEDRDRYLFMIAARWANEVRDTRIYHHPTWHYVNFPVVRRGRRRVLMYPNGQVGIC